MSARAEPRGFFDEGSPYLSHPLLTAERSAVEIDEVEKLVGPISGQVLDVGCGFGRHSLELANRGHEVTGIDPSATMIAAAQASAAAIDATVDFVCLAAADLRSLSQYGLAICLFTTLGQIGGTATDDAVALLERTKQALRPGGKLVVEVPDRDRALAALVTEEQLGPTAVTRSFDADASVLTERFERDADTAYLLRYRLYDSAELIELVRGAGFEIVRHVEHGLVQPPSTMTTVVAQRPA